MLHACHENDDVSMVHETMRRHHVRRLPVVGKRGECIGQVSLRDSARAAALARSDTERLHLADTFTAICG